MVWWEIILSGFIFRYISGMDYVHVSFGVYVVCVYFGSHDVVLKQVHQFRLVQGRSRSVKKLRAYHTQTQHQHYTTQLVDPIGYTPSGDG